MPRFSRFTTRLPATLFLLIATACSNESAQVAAPATLGVGDGPTTITVVNDGAVALTNLRVVTSEGDSLPLISVLNPGQTSAEYRVQAAHAYPFVRAVVRGREVIANPLEGFSGFNPMLTVGPYRLKLRFDETYQGLDPRMVSVVP